MTPAYRAVPSNTETYPAAAPHPPLPTTLDQTSRRPTPLPNTTAARHPPAHTPTSGDRMEGREGDTRAQKKKGPTPAEAGLRLRPSFEECSAKPPTHSSSTVHSGGTTARPQAQRGSRKNTQAGPGVQWEPAHRDTQDRPPECNGRPACYNTKTKKIGSSRAQLRYPPPW